MLFKPLALLAVALGVAAKPLGRPDVSDKAIYAYGKGISGLPIVRVKGTSPLSRNTCMPKVYLAKYDNLDSAYLTNITSAPSGFPIQNVTCTFNPVTTCR